MFEDFKSQRMFSGLDGLRAICALAVMAHHVFGGGADGAAFPAIHLLADGYLGVDMFFSISGFLIVTLLLRERERPEGIRLSAFYLRRTFRIFPIYYLLIGTIFFFYLAISPWRPNGLHYYRDTFWVLALYLQDLVVVPLGIFFHCWSLAMEEQFYLLWPAIEKYCSAPVRGAALLLALAVNEVINFGGLDHWVDTVYGMPAAHLLPIFLCTFTPILLGVLLAHLLNHRRSFHLLQALCRQPWLVPLLLLVMTVTMQVASADLKGVPRLIIHVAMLLLLASIVLRPNSRMTRWLEFRPLARIGRISYGVYLIHVPILILLGTLITKLGRPPPPSLVVFAVDFGVTIPLALASYRWIEQPLILYGRSQRW